MTIPTILHSEWLNKGLEHSCMMAEFLGEISAAPVAFSEEQRTQCFSTLLHLTTPRGYARVADLILVYWNGDNPAQADRPSQSHNRFCKHWKTSVHLTNHHLRELLGHDIRMLSALHNQLISTLCLGLVGVSSGSRRSHQICLD